MTANQDLNLLLALDALLQEGSVTRAAQRAHLTVPAMSRALGRLRTALGDELLVRAGRTLVATPHAVALRDRVHAAAAEAQTLLGPRPHPDVQHLEQTFVVRCNDAVAALLVRPLVDAVLDEAPRVRLVFAPEGEEDAASLRDGRVDLDLGVSGFEEPELRRRLLVKDSYVGVARKGHPLLRRRPTARAYCESAHLSVSRRGRAWGPVDQALQTLGLRRRVVATVPDFLAALQAVVRSDLVTAAPSLLVREAGRHLAVRAFGLPVKTPEIGVSMVWHPRLENDPGHRWLRGKVLQWAQSMKARMPADKPKGPASR